MSRICREVTYEEASYKVSKRICAGKYAPSHIQCKLLPKPLKLHTSDPCNTSYYTETSLKWFGVMFTDSEFKNFVIGLTDVSPNVTSPVLGKYDVCGQGVLDNKPSVDLKCAANMQARRYVILQLNATYPLIFCELEVYVRRTYISPRDAML